MTKLEQIKAECRKAIELGEAATEGPWVTGSIPWKVWADGGYKTICDVLSAGDEIPVTPDLAISQSMGNNRDFIAHARTFSPAAARALLVAIEALETAENCHAQAYDTVVLAIDQIEKEWPN